MTKHKATENDPKPDTNGPGGHMEGDGKNPEGGNIAQTFPGADSGREKGSYQVDKRQASVPQGSNRQTEGRPHERQGGNPGATPNRGPGKESNRSR